MELARRLALGQWFTPPEVADLALGLALPNDPATARVLDPACGDGVFLARARAAGCAPANLHGIELEADVARAARVNVPGASVLQSDLFSVEPPSDGFDVVVGNPPYVRQERLSAEHKRRARARIAADWPELSAAELERLVGRADLAAACVMRALRMVREGGRVALVVSTAMLDAGYAASLWKCVAARARVLALVDAPHERWFTEAAVNAMIIVLERRPSAGEPVAVARLATSTRAAAARAPRIDELAAVADVRSAPADRFDRWSAYLRAPSAWFDFEAAHGDRLVRLGDVAEVRRGITSGANDVFYLTRARAAELGLERELLVPLVRSPRERGAATICLDPAATTHVAIACPADEGELARYPVAARYIGDQAAVAERPTLRARTPWWALSIRPARVFLTKAYAARFVQRFATAPVAADQRVYAVYPESGIDVAAMAAVLNATTTALALESLGRASMGEGALEWTVADAAGLPVIDPRTVGRDALRAFDALMRRPIGSVYEERTRRDRVELDAALVDADLDAIWDGLIASVRRREQRAR